MRIRIANRLLVVMALVTLVLPGGAAADTFDLVAAGVRGGVNDSRNDENFDQYEVYGVFELPWSWQPGAGWVIASRMTGTVGLLRASGDNGGLVSLGVGLEAFRDNSGWIFGLGIRPTLLSRSKYGREDLGGAFYFTSYVGIRYRFGEHFTLGYQFSHMSNAGISSPNPGINMNMLELGYRF